MKHIAYANAEVVLQQNPGYKPTLSFIFTDFEPNINNVRIPKEESQNIINTAAFAPIKIDFSNGEPAGHAGSFPFGVIYHVEESEEKILANAYVWKGEFPEIAEWLAECAEKNIPVNFSWDIWYDEDASFFDPQGVYTLKNIAVKAATVVKNPAYAGRTPMIAFAEDLEANRMNEEELNRLKAELEELRAFKQQVEAEKKMAEEVAAVRSLLESKSIPVNDQRVDFLIRLDPEMRRFYVNDLASFVEETNSLREQIRAAQTSASAVKEESAEAVKIPIPNVISHTSFADPKIIAQQLRQTLNIK